MFLTQQLIIVGINIKNGAVQTDRSDTLAHAEPNNPCQWD